MKHRWKPAGQEPVDEDILECKRCSIIATRREVRRGGLGKCEIQIIYMKPGEKKTFTLDRNTHIIVEYPEIPSDTNKVFFPRVTPREMQLTKGEYTIKIGNLG